MPHLQRWITNLEQTLIDNVQSRAVQRSAPPRFEEQTLPEHYPPDLELEPTHLLIDLYISIPARSVGGRVTTTVQARHAGSLSLKLDAVDFDDLSVRDLDDQPLSWRYDGRKLVILGIGKGKGK